MTQTRMNNTHYRDNEAKKWSSPPWEALWVITDKMGGDLPSLRYPGSLEKALCISIQILCAQMCDFVPRLVYTIHTVLSMNPPVCSCPAQAAVGLTQFILPHLHGTVHLPCWQHPGRTGSTPHSQGSVPKLWTWTFSSGGSAQSFHLDGREDRERQWSSMIQQPPI